MINLIEHVIPNIKDGGGEVLGWEEVRKGRKVKKVKKVKKVIGVGHSVGANAM